MHWIVYAFLGAVFAALVSLFSKIGLGRHIDVTLATTVRSMFMVGFLVLVSLSLGKINGDLFSQIRGREWIFIALSGIAGAISWLFGFYALQYGSAGKVNAIDRLSIVLVVILAAIFLGEPFGWKVFLGSLFIALGAYLIVV